MRFNHNKSDLLVGLFDVGLAVFSGVNKVFFTAGLLHLRGKPVIISRFNGGPHWSPRNSQPRTPPGPEGSNGSGYAVCRGVAGEGHRHILAFLFLVSDCVCLLMGCAVRSNPRPLWRSMPSITSYGLQ